MVLITDLSL